MTPFYIWCRAQAVVVILTLPALALPPLYLLLTGSSLVFGLPAIAFFYLVLKLMQSLFANSKPVSKWVAALACLPGMLLITGGCALLAILFLCEEMHERFEWGFLWLALPAMIGTIIATFISRKEIHRFIYLDLYYPIPDITTQL